MLMCYCFLLVVFPYKDTTFVPKMSWLSLCLPELQVIRQLVTIYIFQEVLSNRSTYDIFQTKCFLELEYCLTVYFGLFESTSVTRTAAASFITSE